MPTTKPRATGGAYIVRGHAFMRITTAPGVRTPKALPWATPEQLAAHDGAAGPCPCVACARARDTQALVNRLRDAGQSDFVENVVKIGATADGAKMADLTGYVDEIVCGKIVIDKPASGPLTFRKFAERWTSGDLHRDFPDHVAEKKSADDDAGRLRKWIYPVVENVPIQSFTLDHALEIMRRLPASLAPASRRHVAQLLVRVLALAVYPCREIPASPIPRGFLPKKSSDKAFTYLYADEDAKLMAAAKRDGGAGGVPLVHRFLYGFLCREGMRSDEAQRLEWRDIDLVRGVVRIDENKTDDPRTWTLDPHVADALRIWRALHPHSVRVFAGLEAAYRLADVFREHLKLAKVDRAELFETTATRRQIRIHDLRATFVTLSLASGRTETWVADRTGHKSSLMINRYRRTARTVAELGLGWLAPLDEAIPELAARQHLVQAGAATSPAAEVAAEVAAAGEGEPSRAILSGGNHSKFRRRDSNSNKRNQNPLSCH